jgi:hypothetical protein
VLRSDSGGCLDTVTRSCRCLCAFSCAVSAGAALVPLVKRAVQTLDIAACLPMLGEVKPLDSASPILAKYEGSPAPHYGERALQAPVVARTARGNLYQMPLGAGESRVLFPAATTSPAAFAITACRPSRCKTPSHRQRRAWACQQTA